MLWPVLIIKLPVKGKVGSCLNISVWIQTKWQFLGTRVQMLWKAAQKFLTTSQISAQPGEVCHLDLINLTDCLAENDATRNKFKACFTKPHFLISHCLPDSSGSPWAISALFFSQDEPGPGIQLPLSSTYTSKLYPNLSYFWLLKC